ncbi:DUF5723 family protein [uncultured Polaribacter sp.]|uniref:DUF5723 family protein n=1 Tax=uncultured Polaribacter sp. TaxID=174711 RepID=UPI00261510BC|nr:DUF5723 family protein [uncultured Polaribacter sp.]
MKQITLLFICFLNFVCISQNRPALYDFAALPQTLLLNPGADVNYNMHIGLPLLSGLSADIGATNFVLSDIFAADNVNINDKITNFIQNTDARDHIKINTQIEVLSGGFRVDRKNYISFGFYQELDAIGYFPKDVLDLARKGNQPFLNRSFSASQLLYKVDLIGVIHAGISRKVNEKLIVGGRVKLYSSAVNLESRNNTGTITTNLGENNIFTHRFQNLNVNFRTAGIVENNEFIREPSTYLKNTFLAGNLGLGVDVGFSYKVNPQLQFSGSLIDFGFINYNKNIDNTVTQGDFIFDGIDLKFNGENINYWDELDEVFKEQLDTEKNEEGYVSLRPAKLFTAVKYSFGKRRSKVCYNNNQNNYYTDAFGAQLFSVFRPLAPQIAFTGFYEKAFSNNLRAKLTYTVDDYSYTNIGLGVSAQIWKLNFYGILDNITALSDLSSANSVSLQFGFNLIFN